MSNLSQESTVQLPQSTSLRPMKRGPRSHGIHKLQPKILWLLDAILLIAFALIVATKAFDLSFHLITILLAIGAFSWQLRGFLFRATICMAGACVVLILSIAFGLTERAALIEIPLMAMTLLPIIVISRRKAKAEEELASVARFPEENPNPILRVTLDGKILYSNLAGAELFQSSGSDHGSCVPDGWKPAIIQSFQSNERKEVEYRIGAKIFACLLVPVGSGGYINIYAGDVTERKRTEEALAEQQQLLRILIDSMPDTIYVKDIQSRMLIANMAQARLLGAKKPEDLLGKTDLDYFPKEFALKYMADEQAILQSGEPLINSEEPSIDPEGNQKWLSTTKMPFRDSQGQIKGIVGIGRDITKRREVEQELRQQRDFALQIMNTMGQGLVVTTADDHFEFVNQALASILGYSPEELVGKTSEEITYPEDLPLLSQAHAKRLTGQGSTYEMRLKHARGRTVHVLITGVPRWRDRQSVASITVVTDLTERNQMEEELRESEARFRELFEASPEAIVLLDPRKTGWPIVDCNQVTCQMNGYIREELIGQSIDILNPAVAGEAERVAYMGRLRREGVLHYEDHHRRKDGTRFPIEVSTKLIALPDGELVLGIDRDITERKRMEDALAQARDQAMIATRLKSEFLATMSHEIRTPMNSIIGMSEMLMGTPLDDQQREFATIIDQSGQALLLLINDILDFSKIEAGKFSLENIDFDVPMTIEGTAEILAVTAREKQLALMTYVSPEIPRWLHGDPGRLRQVLINLIGNAIKFTHEGDIVVRVELRHKSDTGVTVHFAISDTGIGLSEEARQRLFQPFTQADGSTTRKYGGTGLGLAISKRLVEMMGGTIGVESEVGHGSTFWFTARFEIASMVTPAKVDVRGSRALVVDDIKSHCTIVQDYLSSWGIDAHVAASGAEALQALRSANADKEPYTLAIIDLRMPDMDGFMLARAIKKEPTLASTRLILLTGFDEKGQGEKALEAGFSAYLTKPVKQSYLFDTITNVLNIDHPATQQKSPQLKVQAPSPQLATGPLSDKCILLAEDNPINQKVAMLQLSKLGFTAQTVTNGREALDAVSNGGGAYALVLMDCQMPEMDGFDAARAIRKAELTSGRHIPIIAMTANAMEADRERCIAAGMDDYISKPVSLENLNKVLQLWIPQGKEIA